MLGVQLLIDSSALSWSQVSSGPVHTTLSSKDCIRVVWGNSGRCLTSCTAWWEQFWTERVCVVVHWLLSVATASRFSAGRCTDFHWGELELRVSVTNTSSFAGRWWISWPKGSGAVSVRSKRPNQLHARTCVYVCVLNEVKAFLCFDGFSVGMSSGLVSYWIWENKSVKLLNNINVLYNPNSKEVDTDPCCSLHFFNSLGTEETIAGILFYIYWLSHLNSRCSTVPGLCWILCFQMVRGLDSWPVQHQPSHYWLQWAV